MAQLLRANYNFSQAVAEAFDLPYWPLALVSPIQPDQPNFLNRPVAWYELRKLTEYTKQNRQLHMPGYDPNRNQN